MRRQPQSVTTPMNLGAALDELRTYLSTLSPVPDEEWGHCRSLWYSAVFTVGQRPVQPGQVHERIYYIHRGIGRAWLIDKDGRDFTWSLHFNDPSSNVKNLFMVDYASFTERQPSHLGFEAVGDMETLVIERAALENLYRSRSFWNDMGRRIAEAAYAQTHRRALSLLSLSAKERYLSLLTEQPNAPAYVPQRIVASYLGITPQSLSRIRRSLSGKACSPPEANRRFDDTVTKGE